MKEAPQFVDEGDMLLVAIVVFLAVPVVWAAIQLRRLRRALP